MQSNIIYMRIGEKISHFISFLCTRSIEKSVFFFTIMFWFKKASWWINGQFLVLFEIVINIVAPAPVWYSSSQLSGELSLRKSSKPLLSIEQNIDQETFFSLTIRQPWSRLIDFLLTTNRASLAPNCAIHAGNRAKYKQGIFWSQSYGLACTVLNDFTIGQFPVKWTSSCRN